jgi:hypothetical protein
MGFGFVETLGLPGGVKAPSLVAISNGDASKVADSGDLCYAAAGISPPDIDGPGVGGETKSQECVPRAARRSRSRFPPTRDREGHKCR